MRKVIYLLLFHLISISYTLKAQEPTLKLKLETKSDRSIDFNFEKTDPGSYFVIVTFVDLTNCIESSSKTEVAENFSGKLFTLKPSDGTKSVSFSTYSYRYIRGTEKTKPANLVYLLPFKKGTKVTAYESTYLMTTYFGKSTPDDWKAYRFYTEKEEQISASRKGIVVDVKDKFALDSTLSYKYKDQNNELTIEHADGTLARYSGFKKGSICVKVGETVYPETVLGINSKYSIDDPRYSLSFNIYYLKSDVFLNTNKPQNGSFYGFVTPLMFSTAGQTTLIPKKEYVADSNQEIITKEFSKKELKQLQAKMK
ncbi:hypothetical protein [Pedobacter cryophilus]|uniref:Peptidase M23 domain-containing protein n=1 Tax=Pedobacter cryophilus TaxID=2571271 RepID=A0A4U1C146_9SPHI|nr:hypothetical protein [Pedobacter cryophilus]TKB97810.1 hypothetical protein FA046_10665 [Pedobacter cryophilus]